METGNDARGNLFFRLSLKVQGSSAVSWTEIERQLPAGAMLLSDCPNSGGMNRVYRAGTSVLKVAKHSVGSPKPLSLEAEYHVLRRLEGIAGAPQHAEFTSHPAFDVLGYNFVEGTLLGEYLKSQTSGRRECFRILASLTQLLEQLHARGVAHRDLMPDNVLVDNQGGVHLIDFDQATITAPEAAHAVDFPGEARDGVHPCRAFTRDLLPALGVSEEYNRISTDLRALWQRAARSNANSPGQDIAYYQWNFGGLTLPGERPWLQRWQLIRPAIQSLLPGARVLDLGCNMGMLSLHCLLHGAERVTGVDHEADIVECAAQLASIAGVQLNARHGDLNDPRFVA
ncbi:MAG: methyltransferase domain-containing protein, partial [Verrucomicrobiaceae bacterium]